MNYTLNILAVAVNVSSNAASLFFTNVSSLPSSFSLAHYFEVQEGLSLWLCTTKEQWVEELKEFLLCRVPGNCPHSAASTGCPMDCTWSNTVSFLVVSRFEGTEHLLYLLIWAGFCFYHYSSAPATPKAIWALWEQFLNLLIQLLWSRWFRIKWSLSPYPPPLCIARSICGWIGAHGVWEQFCVACQSECLWVLTDCGNPNMLGETSHKEILAVVSRLIAVQGHQSSYRLLSSTTSSITRWLLFCPSMEEVLRGLHK